MKAAMLYGGKDLRVETVPDPTAGPGEVLIRVRAAGICGSDLPFYLGQREFATIPRTLGHELAGDVVEVGEGVTSVEPGQRVTVEPLVTCGRCGHCLSGKYYLCLELAHIGYVHTGGFAELTVAPENKVFPLPDNVTYEAATLLDVFACATHGLNRVPVSVGEDVVILGSGSTGLAYAQMTKMAGANVAMIGRRDEPLEVAVRTTGGLKTINLAKVDPVEAVMEWTNGRGADVVFECVGGRDQTLQLCIEMAARGGTVGIEGVFVGPQTIDAYEPLRRELSLVWIMAYGRRKNRSEFQLTLDLLAAGQLNVEPLITHHVPLDRIVEGFELAVNRKESHAIKVVVVP